MKHIQAANFTSVAHREITLLVIHDMEFPEILTAAEDVANFFKNQQKSTTTGSSAHYCIDKNSVVSCVFDHDVAWGAPNANHNGLQFEFAGRASQSKREWNDDYSHTMLFDVGAHLFARKALRYSIPAVLVEADDLRRGRAGITAHRFVTAAYPGSGTHQDPGTDFPFHDFVAEVRKIKQHLKSQ